MENENAVQRMFLCTFGFYLAMSVAQLHAKARAFPAARGLSAQDIVADVKWHLREMGKIEQDQGLLPWYGN